MDRVVLWSAALMALGYLIADEFEYPGNSILGTAVRSLLSIFEPSKQKPPGPKATA